MSDEGERSSSSSEEVKFSEFEGVLGVDEIVRRIPKFFTISFASRRNSGKSHLCRQLVQLLLRQKKCDIALVLSGTAELNDDWDFLPPGLVQSFSEVTLVNLWSRQQKATLEWRSAGKSTKLVPQHVLVVLDDCLSDPAALRSKVIEMYYTKCRHIHVSFICISQHTSALLTPVIRANSDIILFSKLSRVQLKRLADEVTHMSESDFIRVSEACGGHDFNFLLLDKYIQSSDPLDCITVVRAAAKSR